MSHTLTIVVADSLMGLLSDWSLDGTMIVLGTSLILLPALSRIEEEHPME